MPTNGWEDDACDVTLYESVYCDILSGWEVMKKASYWGLIWAESAKISRIMSENLPTQNLVERRRGVFSNGFQVIGTFGGIHNFGVSGNLVGRKDVQKRNFERPMTAL